MIQISLTQEDKDLALKLEKEKLEKLPRGGNYTDLEADDRFYFGYLGEFAFAKLLKMYHKQGTHFINRTVTAGQEDFWVYLKGMKRTIDVKTAGKEYHRMICHPEKQHEKYRYDYYIGAKLVADSIRFYGYILHDSFHGPNNLKGHTVPTMWEWLDQLPRIERFLDVLSDGELETKQIQ